MNLWIRAGFDNIWSTIHYTWGSKNQMRDTSWSLNMQIRRWNWDSVFKQNFPESGVHNDDRLDLIHLRVSLMKFTAYFNGGVDNEERNSLVWNDVGKKHSRNLLHLCEFPLASNTVLSVGCVIIEQCFTYRGYPFSRPDLWCHLSFSRAPQVNIRLSSKDWIRSIGDSFASTENQTNMDDVNCYLLIQCLWSNCPNLWAYRN